ncbi:Anaphase-promoting complex subunit 2 [Neolecta irregularis DAH-3]|uniref:Anaphase-promoting complex subunit 2 n=1 Tax=Neolecta irregularis (strain DAH-3) TaxID=1198029 RepID=A0A1U7LRU9_NEOID|nr:Anaphase-promoting complex subunit 2 [Neolecta irregularis DAH-3]|eukprot:OLL25396.1 Anaphase-promoting complex subunit 2 [Neolecta irregularis DAH-3]
MSPIPDRQSVFDQIFKRPKAGVTLNAEENNICWMSLTRWLTNSLSNHSRCTLETDVEIREKLSSIREAGLESRLSAWYIDQVRRDFIKEHSSRLLNRAVLSDDLQCFIMDLASIYESYERPLVLLDTGEKNIEKLQLSLHALFQYHIDIPRLAQRIKLWVSTTVTEWSEESITDDTFLESSRTLGKVGLGRLFQGIVAEVIASSMKDYISENFANEWEASVLPQMTDWISQKVFTFVHQVCQNQDDNLREILEGLAKRSLVDLRTSELFDIIKDFPYSESAIDDLKVPNNTPQRTQIVQTFQEAYAAQQALPNCHSCRKRMLHPGAHTSDIISQYISTMKAFRILEPHGASAFPDVYLICREREDTIRCIMTGLVGEDSDLADELMQETAEVDIDDFDDMNWIPDPVDAGPDYRKDNGDVIAALVSIYENTEVFVKELQILLADRLLALVDYDMDREIRNIELLKLRFGEANLQMCDIMLKDIADSKRLDDQIHGTKFEEIKASFSPNFANWLFWPAFRTENIILPSELNLELRKYARAFEELKPSRKLEVLPHLGWVDIELDLEDRHLALSVTPAQATVIYQFLETDTNTLDSLLELFNNDRASTLRAILYWVRIGVLKETSKDQYFLLEKAESFAPGAASVVEQPVSAIQSAVDISASEMQMYWSYITNMLKNMGAQPAERIQSILTMLVPPPNLYSKSLNELQAFLEEMVNEEKLEFVTGNYKLKK